MKMSQWGLFYFRNPGAENITKHVMYCVFIRDNWLIVVIFSQNVVTQQ